MRPLAPAPTTPSARLCALVAALTTLGAPLSLAQSPSQGPGTPALTLPALTAVAAAGAPAWHALTPGQRQALAPLTKDWTAMDAAQRAKWLELAARFPSMAPDEQQRVQQRMADWSRLSPAERGRARLTFQESKQLSAEEKQARWQAYQALPAQEREQLTARGQQSVQQPTAPAPTQAMALDVAQPKQNTVVKLPAATPVARPVAPTVVQNKPGATTTLMNKSPAPPRHQQPGEPKIAAGPGQVNSSTLLPKTGPQKAVAPASAPVPR